MPRRAKAPSQILATVMFTDIVGSTEMAATLGDRDWKRLLAKHHAIMRKELKRHRGREIDTAGDGFFNTFDQPGDAIACAVAVSERLEPLGVHIRAGVHMGQVEVDGPKVQGIAVNIGARVMSKAGDDEVLVSSTVRDALAGAEVQFEDRGTALLKGVPGEWRLFAVEKSPQLIATALGNEPVAIPAHGGEAEPEPKPSWIRRPKSWAVLAIGLVAVVAVVVVATRSRGGDDFTPIVDSVVRLDPSTGVVDGGALVGSFPMGLAEDAGALWIADSRGATVTRVDTSTFAEESFGTGTDGDPFDVAIGDESIWVSLGGAGRELLRYDTDGTVVKKIPIGTGYGAVAFAEDTVWLTNADDAVLGSVDPVTAKLTEFPLEGAERPQGLVIEADSIWIADDLGEQVLRFDISTGGVTPIALDGPPSGIALGEGSVWVTIPEQDKVVRIDPAEERPANTIEGVCDNPRGIAVGEGSVWVTCTNDGTVAKIAAADGRVDNRQSVGTGMSPEGIVVTDDGVWVTIHAR